MSIASVQEVNCELCILGAGIAGMNALFAASRYLGRNQMVVLIDQKPRAGGMWHTAYDYVRLHQPHPLFTVGNLEWTSGRDRTHLASRDEVVAHLRHCMETLRKQLLLDERYGYQYRSHVETSDPSYPVTIECEAIAEGAPALRVRAKRLVKAFGYNIQDSTPIRLSSVQVHSIAPNGFDLRGPEMRASSAPVYIVGAGKTGTDTAYTLINNYPGRDVNLLIGQGMMFGRRDKFFPRGLKRYYGGDTPVASFLDLARRFDGHNEREVLELFRSRYGVSLLPGAQRFGIGLLSVEENDFIARGAHAIIPDYLTDVVDRDGQPTMILRHKTVPVEPGSWFINCTGYLFKNRLSYEPYVSASGNVVSVQPSSAIHFLSTCASYLLVHLAYLDKLKGLPLYEVDYGELNQKSRDALGCVVMSHTLYNAGVLTRALPFRVEREFGTNMEHWYPWHRRILDAVRVVGYLKRHPDHLRRTLDVVRERFDVRCGPLQQTHSGGLRVAAARSYPRNQLEV